VPHGGAHDGSVRSRVIVLASLVMGLACGPETSPDFSGVYAVTKANGTCVIDHPEAPAFFVSYGAEDLVLEDDGTGTFPLALPLPPCPVVGSFESDEIRLTADDCVIGLETAETEDYAVEYTDGRGRGRWEDGVLVLRLEMGRRYLSIPYDLPDWWDDPGSCSASYELEPLDVD
jgi:hypothetical protein